MSQKNFFPNISVGHSKEIFLIDPGLDFQSPHVFSLTPTNSSPSIIPESFAVGQKGRGLLELASLRLPVPPGFILPMGFFPGTEGAFSLGETDLWEKGRGADGCKKIETFGGLGVSEPLAPESLLGPWISALNAIAEGLRFFQNKIGCVLGDSFNPLFLSVRSSGAVSMPGMMDTLLNVGLNSVTKNALGLRLGSPAAAEALSQKHCAHLCHHPVPGGWGYFCQVVSTLAPYLSKANREILGFVHWDPQDPLCVFTQFWRGIFQVLESKESQRACSYRAHYASTQPPSSHMTPDFSLDTAVVIQAMVFGNGYGSDKDLSCTGVFFTRNPNTGEDAIFGEYLVKSQGESLVSGLETPQPIEHLFQQYPAWRQVFYGLKACLERHFKNMQDVEFTMEKGSLWILQTRNGKRSAQGALVMGRDMVCQGLQTISHLFRSLGEKDIEEILRPQLSCDVGLVLVAKGLGVSSGAVSGKAVFLGNCVTPEDIFVTDEIRPEDIAPMLRAKGVITLRGGLTSHAAVILRSLGKICIVSCRGPEGADGIFSTFGPGIPNEPVVIWPSFSLKAGDWLTLDGTRGNVFLGKGMIDAQIPVWTWGALSQEDFSCSKMGETPSPEFDAASDYKEKKISNFFASSAECDLHWAERGIRPESILYCSTPSTASATPSLTEKAIGGVQILEEGGFGGGILGQALRDILTWAKNRSSMRILVNGDTPEEIATGLALGAQGVGLVRSEHMMVRPSCLLAMQCFILSETDIERTRFLSILQRLHCQEIKELLKALCGFPMTFRLLDPPLHEFLPTQPSSWEELSRAMCVPTERLMERLEVLKEVNPMMGHRGVRLAMTYIGLYEMQVAAMGEALKELASEGYLLPSTVRFLIPFVTDVAEVHYLRTNIPALRDFPLGVMIETPRAALLAGDFARQVDFLSIGTNDLTQMTWGLSRDDYGSFFPYEGAPDLPDPFCALDEGGVGRLIELACQEARKVKKAIDISVCGEHGAFSNGVAFFYRLGVCSISCSPWRVPKVLWTAARLADTFHHKGL